MTALVKIRSERDRMSAIERRIADFMLENAQLLRDYSSQQLANALGISQSSVVKFSQKLGFKGYPDLKYSIGEAVARAGGGDEGVAAVATVEDPRTALADSPVIITVAPNGAYKKAADHPAVPLTAAALASEARACLEAGAAMMHMHVRKPDGSHLLDAQAYRDALAAVHKAVGDELLVEAGRRIVGTEVEYGLYAPGDAAETVAERLATAVACELDRGPGHLGGYLPNGGRLYVDVGTHPEYATPECPTIDQAVAHELAGEELVGLVIAQATADGIIPATKLNKRVVDSAGHA